MSSGPTFPFSGILATASATVSSFHLSYHLVCAATKADAASGKPKANPKDSHGSDNTASQNGSLASRPSNGSEDPLTAPLLSGVAEASQPTAKSPFYIAFAISAFRLCFVAAGLGTLLTLHLADDGSTDEDDDDRLGLVLLLGIGAGSVLLLLLGDLAAYYLNGLSSPSASPLDSDYPSFMCVMSSLLLLAGASVNVSRGSIGTADVESLAALGLAVVNLCAALGTR